MSSLDNKISKTEWYYFPKCEDSIITWKFKKLYFEDGTIIFKGLYF